MYSKIIIKPILTEKMAILEERENKHAFLVFKNANKKLLVIKNGDHSLSSKKNLNKIRTELDNIVSNSI